MNEDDIDVDRKSLTEYYRGFYDGFRAAKDFDKLNLIPWQPAPTDTDSELVCKKCKMVFKGAMGYVCPTNDCPIQLKVS